MDVTVSNTSIGDKMKYIYTKKEESLIKKLYKEGHGSPFIAKKLGRKTSSIVSYLKRTLGNLRSCSESAKKYTVNEKYFDKIDTPEKAYWLGFIYADGYVAHDKYSYKLGITLSEKDKDHLERFKKSICATYPIKTYAPTIKSTNYTKNPYSKIVIYSKTVYDQMIRHGVFEHKTNILDKPTIEESLERYFILGYMDGDGCIAISHRNKSSQLSFCVKILGTTKLLDFIKNFIEKHQIATIRKYYKRKPGQDVSSLELPGNIQVKHFLDLLYDNKVSVYLPRKYNRYKLLCDMLNSRALSKDKA